MTKQEAIEAIEKFRSLAHGHAVLAEALDMAIEALSAQEKPYLWQKEMVKILSAQLDNNSTKLDNEIGEWVYEERKRLDDETDDGPVYVTQKWWKCSKCGFDMGFLSSKPSDKYCPMCGDKKR